MAYRTPVQSNGDRNVENIMLSMNKIKKVFAFVISGIMLVQLAGYSFDISSLISLETSN